MLRAPSCRAFLILSLGMYTSQMNSEAEIRVFVNLQKSALPW
jgi:hypothetical protein